MGTCLICRQSIRFNDKVLWLVISDLETISPGTRFFYFNLEQICTGEITLLLYLVLTRDTAVRYGVYYVLYVLTSQTNWALGTHVSVQIQMLQCWKRMDSHHTCFISEYIVVCIQCVATR